VHDKPVVTVVGTINVASLVGVAPFGVHDPVQVPAVLAVSTYVPPFRVTEQFVEVPDPRLQDAPGGLLVKDVGLPLADAMLSATVEGVGGVVEHPVGSGDMALLHGSTPCKFTVAVGEPVDVVNMQLPEPAAPSWLRSAPITAVV